MILVDRGPEHPDLPAIRTAELARIEVIRSAGRFPRSDEFGARLRAVRSLLRARQHFVCCYCEKFSEEKYATVEHVRPKAETRRSNGRLERGYWWLAWSWENLLFCCEQCNGHKDTWFPLRGDDQPPHVGRPLAERDVPPGHEHPLLLDPAADDGIAAIQFRLVRGRWIPQPREGSRRGYETIQRIQLDRSDLLDLYTSVARDLDESVARIRSAMSTTTPPSSVVSAIWHEVLRRQLRPGAPLCGLRYDIFDHHFPRRVRQRWDISLDEHASRLTARRTGA